MSGLDLYTVGRLLGHAVAAARPRGREYTLSDGAPAHFGVRVQPTGVRSFIVQTRVEGRMRTLTLGRFPETSLADARKEAAAVLARVWAGEDVTLGRRRQWRRAEPVSAAARHTLALAATLSW